MIGLLSLVASTQKSPDICIRTMGTSGDWRGHIDGSGSVISPNNTYNGLDVFEYKWNIVTGEFVISFGVAGNDELDNVVQISVSHINRPDRNSASWDATDTDYSFIDLELAQWIGSDLDRSCFLIELQFTEIINLEFGEILTGTGA